MLKALAVLMLVVLIAATIIALYEGILLPIIRPFFKNKQKL